MGSCGWGRMLIRTFNRHQTENGRTKIPHPLALAPGSRPGCGEDLTGLSTQGTFRFDSGARDQEQSGQAAKSSDKRHQ